MNRAIAPLHPTAGFLSLFTIFVEQKSKTCLTCGKTLNSLEYKRENSLNAMAETVTLQIPEKLYQRLVNTARAAKRPLEQIMLQALKVGSPPDWDNVPDEFQVDLAALDRMEDEALWKIACSRKTAVEMSRYDDLLERNQSNTLTQDDKVGVNGAANRG